MNSTNELECRVTNQFINVSRGTIGKWTGSYPMGYLQSIERLYGKSQNFLHLFGGLMQEGTTIDVNAKLRPVVCAVCESLPFKEDTFDRIYADPPYDENHVIHYTDFLTTLARTKPKYEPFKFVREAFRVLKPGGLLFVLHWIVYPALFGFKHHAVNAVNQGPNHRIRAMTVLEKPLDATNPIYTSNPQMKLGEFFE